MDWLETLCRLAAAHGPSGDEGAVSALLEQLAAPLADDCRRDTLGNLIVHKKGSGPRVMFSAHMDSIGLIATYLDDKGFVRFGKLGGLEAKAIYQAPVAFSNGARGLVAVSEDKEDGECKLSDLYVDVGASSREEAERLVQTYSDLILRLSFTYLKNTEDAKDICQTVFLRLLEKPREFQSPEHERAWIIRTAVNVCKDQLKSSWRRTTVDLSAASDARAPEAEEGSLWAAVALLPPKYRTVIYLYYYEGYSANEIAQMLGEKPATVATRLSRGRDKLRIQLEQEALT